MLQFTSLAALTVAAVSAQAPIFVPPSASTLDGDAFGAWPGVNSDFRLQVIVGASHLPRGGASISGLAVRRDGQYAKALAGGRARLTVRVSDGAALPARTRDLFAANHARPPVQVFQGEVSYPASPALGHRHAAGWQPMHVIDIPFAVPIAYGSGSLCMEVEGAEVVAGGAMWRVDYFADFAARGSEQVVGLGCGQFVGPARQGAWGEPATLTVGSTTRVFTWGQPGTPAFLMIGLQPLGAPLDALGAPGCFLHLVPELTLTAWLSAPTRSDLPGHVPFALQVPGDGSLLSGTFLAQAGNLELRPPFTNSAHLTTSQGLSLRIGPTVPSLDAAVVESRHVFPYPDSGFVDLTRAPVLRLTTN